MIAQSFSSVNKIQRANGGTLDSANIGINKLLFGPNGSALERELDKNENSAAIPMEKAELMTVKWRAYGATINTVFLCFLN